MRVCDVIRGDIDGIVAEWAEAARREIPPAGALPMLMLLDHMPTLLAEMARWLESGGKRSVEDYWKEVRHHAVTRLAEDFDIRQVVHEYRLLRRVLVRRLVAVQHKLANLDDFARMNEALDMGLAESVDRFAKAREEILARTGEFRERFIGIVSHDLRNPLNAIQMAAGLLLRSEQLPVSLSRTTSRIVVNAERMARMIADLLDLTRGRLGGGIPIERKHADVGEIAWSVLENMELVRPDRTIEREVNGHFVGQWDSDRVAQALSNLVGNALDHGQEGTSVRVELHGEDEERVEIRVHNEGSPIPAGEQAAIFEPFRTGATSMARRPPPTTGGSLGLGLYIAREIARAHGGDITVMSNAVDGTTFSMTLPRVPPSRPTPAA